MLYYLHHLSGYWPVLNVTRYITFRTAAASLTALVIGLLRRALDDPEAARVSDRAGDPTGRSRPRTAPRPGTPTMGGLLILTSVLVPTLLWADLATPFVWIAVLATAAFRRRLDSPTTTSRSCAVLTTGCCPATRCSGRQSSALAVGVALLVLASHDLYNTRLIFPFFKRLIPDLAYLYLPFAAFVLVGSTNVVNLTDGLDGLAISVFAVSAAAFTALAYVSTHAVFANYLQLVRLPPEAAELTIFCGALVGASLGVPLVELLSR